MTDLVRSCAGKNRYDTEDKARAVAVQCWHDRRVWLRVYACECGGFHLTRRDAAPMMREGWRLPRISERQRNIDRKRNKRRRAG